jgi:ribonuclease T2
MMFVLSWSPNFCAGQGNSNPNDPQCGTGRSHGFVVHGLWPQYEQRRGNCPGPFDCSHAPGADAALASEMLDIMPSPRLIAHEWTRHGTCSGMDAAGYFARIRELYQAFQIPPEYRRPATAIRVAPAEFEKKLLGANPGYAAGGVAIRCQGQFLSEVWICYDKNFKPRVCASGVNDACRQNAMLIRPVRTP